MRKSLQPWVCTNCSRQKSSYQSLTTAASSRSARALAAASLAAGQKKPSSSHALSSTALSSHTLSQHHDDKTLRQIFDSKACWNDFSRSRRTSLFRPNVGLFQNRYLKTPDGFDDLARVTLARCRKIVDKILAINTLEGYRAIVKDMDRLSDLLCRIIDMADFVRSTHPGLAFQDAASKAHARMFEYMVTLNTTTGLNDQLRVALGNPEVRGSWSEEELLVAQILHKDFSQSAIDLPAAQRQRFVRLSNSINELGSRFLDSMSPERSHLTFESSQLRGMSPLLLQRLMDRRGKVRLPTTGSAATNALRFAEDEEVRRQVYIASRTASQQQIHTLEELLRQRAELAKLSGHESFGGMSLADKMAKSPQAVVTFLEALSRNNRSKVHRELEEMQKLKTASSSEQHGTINAWDREFYRHRMAAHSASRSRSADFLPAYFSLGTVMQGLSRLFTRQYGVRFIPRASEPGETWNSDVRRLDVVDEDAGHIAVVYCDLFARPGKSPNPAHFTLRCSRLISSAEMGELAQSDPSLRDDPSKLANDGMAISASVEAGSFYQLPTIALICDFPAPKDSTSQPVPTLLPLASVKTLFHEMGHAIHSILGRTKLQNVSGTRCPTDFAELPSVLMEHFAVDASVLALFARHWETDAPLPYALVADSLAREQAGAAADTESQILLALFDQHCHSTAAASTTLAFDSTAAAHALYAQYSSVPEPHETRWHGFFGHLVGYGASYYAYLFDRAIATKVWATCFGDGRDGAAVAREPGERFKSEVLRWGGSRGAWRCVAGVLGAEGEGLEEGGEAAMAKVGRWGVKD